ncbi:MAG: hypothetical protein ACXWIQ_01385 [Caldimonas sp.]
MAYPNDRRKHTGEEDELSPEYVAVLLACGGEVRESDKAALRGPEVERRRSRRKDDPEPAGPAAVIGK